MPYARRRRIRRRNPRRPARLRRHYRRRYGRLPKTSGLLTGFRPTMLMKHKYCERLSINCVLGALGAYTLTGNDLYDPNYTGTGHQPYYRDQMAALYNNYIVYACKLILRPSADTGTDFALLVRPTLDATAVASMELEMERPGSVYKIVSDENPSRGTIKVFRKTKSISGYPGSLDISWHGLSGASPSDKWFFQIAAQPRDIATTTYVNLDVEIIYYARWWDRKGVAQS